MKTYYFPIQSLSLAHYFGSAIIKPAKYFTNKPHDIQDKFKDFLLFTTKFGTAETDCCLEIVLTDEESKDLIDVKGGWLLFDVKPLPVTRIRKIYFSDKEKRDITITNISMSTAYVPERLVEIRKFDNNPTDVICIPNDCGGVEQKEGIIKYDRFLGALALMKTVGDPYMNYSPNYIPTLAFFNTLIDEQLHQVYPDFKNSYRGLFTNSKGFEQVIPYLNKSIDEQLLFEVADKNNQVIKKEKITKVIDIDSFTDTWTYTIAVLNTFGVGDEGRRRRIDGLIQSHFSEIKKEKAEGVALCYGYNRGYSAFTKDYGIKEKVSYKYRLESQLDYYTIESVYQYVFNGIVSSSFPYLDEWCPKLHVEGSKRRNGYVILDEVIIGKKKAEVFSEEWWNGLFPKFIKECGRFANETFLFFKNVCEEMKEDIEEEKEDLIFEYENKLSGCNKYIDELTNKLNQKTIESSLVQERDNCEVTPISDKTELIHKCLELKNKTNTELKKLAKAKGIIVPSKPSKEDIDVLIEKLLSQDFFF